MIRQREKNLFHLHIDQAYRKVDLIIPFREIMVVEKRPDNPGRDNFDLQSALVITTKDQVTCLRNEVSFKTIFVYSRVELLFSLDFLIEHLSSRNYQIFYHSTTKQFYQRPIYLK